jgi:hypothetical protein
MDSLFAPLDKGRVSTGILYDRVMPLANIHLFNTPQGPAISDYSFYCQAYFELYEAAYSNTGWLKPLHLQAWAEGEALKKNYTLGVLDFEFNNIDSNAVFNGLLNISNGQVYDVPGAANPYWNRRFQAAAILADEIPSGLATLKYNPGFIKTNQAISISSIQLNFGVIGTYVLSTTNPSVLVNFTGSGVKEFTITVQYSNGDSFSHQSQVQIGSNTNPYSSKPEGVTAQLPDATFWITSKYSYQGTGEPQPYYAKGKVSIWWKRNAQNQPEHGIKKPVIIIDGFDPQGKRLDTSIYNLFVYDSTIFVNGQPATQKFNFADELRKNGFDIVVLDMPGYTKDFPSTINYVNSIRSYPRALYDNTAPDSLKGVIFGGGDFQQRNGYLLEYLIDYCNLEMQANNSTEKIVVVGPSMGGQISRYALRDMEKRGQNHNCRLWVCFDSNNQGSYAPMGLQYSLSAFATGSQEAAFTKGVFLDCPETKQSLLHHYSAGTLSVNGASGFFDQYYGEVNNPSFGFPQASGLRKIAMISGSDLGVPQTFGTACQQATRTDLRFRPHSFAQWVGLFTNPLYGISAGILAAIIPSKVHKTYLAPASGQCVVFKLNSSLETSVQAPSWCSTSLDMTQGGHFPAFTVYKNELNGKRPKNWFFNLVQITVDDYIGSQVQQLTYSTLGIGLGTMPDPTRKWSDNFRINSNGQAIDVTCSESKESPFDMYWGPDINTRHDSLLLGHVVRLRKEIIDKQNWPRTKFEKYAHVTSDKILICPGETATFSIFPAPSGGVFNWTTSDPAFQIVSGQGTGSIVVQHNGTSANQGSYQVTCNGESDCFIYNIHYYNIWAGLYNPVWSYNSPTNPIETLLQSTSSQVVFNQVCAGNQIVATTRPKQDRNIVWQLLSVNGSINWSQSGDNLNLWFSDINQQAYFKVLVTNPCGTAEYFYNFQSVLSANCIFMRNTELLGANEIKVLVAPNPSSNNISVSLKNMNSGPVNTVIKEVRLVDKTGVVQRIIRTGIKGGQVMIDVSGLPTDIYTILVFNGQVWHTGKFLKL